MKLTKFSLVFLLVAVLSLTLGAQKWVDMMLDPNINFHETQKEFNAYWNSKSYEKGKGFKQFKRWEYMMQRRVDAQGNLKVSDDYQKAIFNNLGTSSKTWHADSASWMALGPFGGAYGSGAGRLNCIAFHPTLTNVLFAGSPSGGIWKSENNGSSWFSMNNSLVNLGITDIVIDPLNPNVMYAGTGDADGGDTPSFGVIKSTDGGVTWQPTGLTRSVTQGSTIYKLAMHPTNPLELYAAVNNGFFKTVDGGVSWTSMKLGAYRDFAFMPGTPSTIYLTTNTTVFKSIDAGGTWVTLNYNPTTTIRRIAIAVTAAAPNNLYVLAGRSSDNGFAGFYKSTDGGTTFPSKVTSPNLLGWSHKGTDSGGQAWYDLAISVSPTDANKVHIGGVNVWRSLNGGTSWMISGHWQGRTASYVHADIHRLVYSPHGNRLWACTDGGAFKTTNNGALWTQFNSGLNIGQIYKFGTSTTNAGKIITGWQDNGSNFYDGISWKNVLGGDGMECLIDYSNNTTMYGSLYYGNIRRSTNGGLDWTSISDDITENGSWITPFIQDPNNSTHLYAGFYNIWKTTNQGNTWNKISNFSFSQYVRGIAIVPSNSQVIYAITDSRVMVTKNGGSTWTQATGTGTGNNTYIAVHPQNVNIAFLTKSGYNSSSKVYVTYDAGLTWTNISYDLPNLPVNCIVYENGTDDRVYVGTDVGVYVTDSTMTSWTQFSKGLPNVIVNELEIFYPTNKLRAATYGTGVWETFLVGYNTTAENIQEKSLSVSLFPNPTDGQFTIELKNLKTGDYSFNVEIYNQLGSKIYADSYNNQSSFNISSKKFEKGIYIVKLYNSEYSFTKKLIIK